MERPSIAGISEESKATKPRAMTLPSSADISTVSPALNSPSIALTPAGRSEVPRSRRALTAPASIVNLPLLLAA